jgi:hypothetical protein
MAFLARLAKALGRRPSAGSVDARGPVFISYRQSDGTDAAVAVAWALRAAGIPVWHDRSDLPPGDTNRRLVEALKSGLSGAVLLVTPEIKASRVVRKVELPQLLELERDPAFTFAVGSVVERDDGKLDYDAPDRLLRQRKGRLARLDQQPVRTPRERADVARAHARRRMEALRLDVERADRVLTLDVQTRIPPFATRPDADLVLRLRPPVVGDRRPNRAGLEDLERFLGDLPQLVALAGAEHLRARGGAHLSVAYAIGAALPTTLIGRVEVVDTNGDSWMLQGNAPVPVPTGRPPGRLEVVDSRHPGVDPGACVVYLDLNPTRNDGAYAALLSALGPRVAALHARPRGDLLLDPAEAAVITGEAAHLVREWVGRSAATEVHLLLRCPWGVALLLGRALNTVRARVYEWEDGPDDAGEIVAPRYLPSLVVRSGAGGSPIETVVLPTRVTP